MLKRSALLTKILWGLSVLIPTVSVLVFQATFETNDDVTIISLLNGYFGVPTDNNIAFVSPLLAFALQKLYSLWPSIPWFSWAIVLGLFFSHILIAQVVSRSSLTHWGKGLLGLSLPAFFLQLYVVPSFTATSLCLLLTSTARARFCGERSRWLDKTFIILCFAYGYFLRPGLLLVWLLFSAPLLVVLVWNKQLSWIAHRSVYAGIIGVVLVGLLSNWFTMEPSDRAFKEANQVRSAFADTAQGEWGEKTHQALSAANWSPSDYYIVKDFWWYFDKSVFGPEQIKIFLSQNTTTKRLFSSKNFLDNVQAFRMELIVLCLIMAFVLTLEIIMAKGIRLKKAVRMWPLLLLVICFVSLASVRFPVRVAYPTFIFILGSVPLWISTTKSEVAQQTKLLGITLLLITVGILGYFGQRKIDQFQGRERYSAAERSYAQRCFADVTRKYPGKNIFLPTYVYSLYDTIRPFIEYRNADIPQMMPSGWLCYSPVYTRSLEKEGFDPNQLIIPQFAGHEKVLFYFWQHEEISFEFFVKNLRQYLLKHYSWPETREFLTARVLVDYRAMLGSPHGLVFFTIEKSKRP